MKTLETNKNVVCFRCLGQIYKHTIIQLVIFKTTPTQSQTRGFHWETISLGHFFKLY